MRSKAATHLRPEDFLVVARAPELLSTDPHLTHCLTCRRKARALAEGLEMMKVEAGQDVPEPAGRAIARRHMAKAVSLAKDAEEIGKRLVAEAELGDVLIASLGIAKHPALADGLIVACQLGASLAARRPQEARELATVVRATSEGELPRRHPLRPFVLVESLLLTSQAALVQGAAQEAARYASRATRLAERYEAPPLTIARCWFFHAGALTALSQNVVAATLTRTAMKIFADAGQDHWVGKAEVMLGLILFADDIPSLEALAFFDAGLSRLDPVLDAHNVVSAMQNRASLLQSLGRLQEARAAYRATIEAAIKINAEAISIAARVNLLTLAMEEGKTGEVLLKGERILGQAENAGLPEHAFFCRLVLAEALATAGRLDAARRLVADMARFREGAIRVNASEVELLEDLRQLRQRMTGTGRPA